MSSLVFLSVLIVVNGGDNVRVVRLIFHFSVDARIHACVRVFVSA